MKKQFSNIKLLVLFSIVVSGVYFVSSYSHAPVTVLGSVESVMSQCASAAYRPHCYEEQIPELMNELSTEDVFDVVREVRKKDSDYVFCHVLAHEIGEREVRKDPEKWKEVLALGPTDGLCSNGYAHGAILARFNRESFTETELTEVENDLKNACEGSNTFVPTELQKAICYHGLGHVIVHLTEADVERALGVCTRVSIKEDGRNYQTVCNEGVYMQLFQPLEPEDYALIDTLTIKPSRENIAEFCSVHSTVESEYNTCWREAWPFFDQELKTGEGIINYCGQLDTNEGMHQCMVTTVTIHARGNLRNSDQMAAVCSELPEAYQGMCFARGANAFLEEDQNLIEEGIRFCSLSPNETVEHECYSFLAQVSSFNFQKDSEAYERLCSSLPSEWGASCRGD